MPTEYRPTLREIVSEMERELVSSEPVKFGKYFLGVGTMFTMGPYAIPSLIRYLRGPIKLRGRSMSKSEVLGGFAGFATGVVVDWSVINVYANDLKYLAMPVTANAVSLVYEWGRHARERLIESRRPRESVRG